MTVADEKVSPPLWISSLKQVHRLRPLCVKLHATRVVLPRAISEGIREHIKHLLGEGYEELLCRQGIHLAGGSIRLADVSVSDHLPDDVVVLAGSGKVHILKLTPDDSEEK